MTYLGIGLVALSFFIIGWAVLSFRRDRRRKKRRAASLEWAAKMALGKIASGEISISDMAWARHMKDRLWEED
jgi:hypothetical protein